jgi:hypothetical protein
LRQLLSRKDLQCLPIGLNRCIQVCMNSGSGCAY